MGGLWYWGNLLENNLLNVKTQPHSITRYPMLLYFFNPYPANVEKMVSK